MREREKEAREREARYSNGHLFNSLTVSGTTLCSACNKSITAKEALSCPSESHRHTHIHRIQNPLVKMLKNNGLQMNTTFCSCRWHFVNSILTISVENISGVCCSTQ